MNDDANLLRDYATTRSEPAFAALVQRHLDLVYFAALRRCRGDAHRAEEVTQQVFTALARNAASLAGHRVLAGWLYVATRNTAANLRRAEHTRRAREAEAHAMSEALTPPSSADSLAAATDWEQLRPTLDSVMDELGEPDRDAVLLRFFENRPFAEIAATLRMTEDAARMRVARALDKLRRRLERRGITSTSAVLATALAGQAAFAKPAGLAASVTTSALAGSAAAAVAAGGLATFGFMSTGKFSAGAVVAALVLMTSLAGNAWLLSRPKPQPPTAATSTIVVASLPAANAPIEPLALVKNADLAALRDQMRGAGASDAAVRAALAGILRRRYREQRSTDIAARLARGWWRDQERTWGTANDIQLPFDDLRLMHEMITKPLEQLLGVDPLDAAEADARYAFLPPELRQQFGRLDRASVGGFSRTGDRDVDEKIRTDFYEQVRLRDEERKTLLAGLTPEQRADYDMRFGPFAAGLARQLEQVAVTEQEFRAVFPIADDYAKSYAAIEKQEDAAAAKHALDRRAAQELIAALGYDRALDYIWSGSTEYPAYARVARDANLPATAAGRVLQLAAETGEQAAAIHQDAAAPAAQKRAALLALQQTTRAQLDALIPLAAQQRLAPHALSWINGLADGRYKLIATAMPGQVRATIMGGIVSVDAPVPAYRPSQNLVPPRLPGR